MDHFLIDSIDTEILKILQFDGRITQRELGHRIGLSPNAAGARMQRLVGAGVITGFQAKVNQNLLGRSIEVVIDVSCAPGPALDHLRKLINGDERVVDYKRLGGPVDMRIDAWVKDTADLESLIDDLRAVDGVTGTVCSVVLEHPPAGMAADRSLYD